MKQIEFLEDLARLDIEREQRAGIPEVVYSETKTVEQLVAIAEAICKAKGRAILSRMREGQLVAVRKQLSASLEVEAYAQDRLAVVHRPDTNCPQTGGVIAVMAAGTSDIPVAEEARVMAREMGCEVLTYYDVGIAGLHRLVEPIRESVERNVSVVVAVAGMEGALPTLVKGLVPAPVIGVPTSVGYGVARGGEAALLTMLNSCSLGLTVVNIDNGIGAGATAALIANRERHQSRLNDENSQQAH